MTMLHFVYEHDGRASMSRTLHETRHGALLEALWLFGNDVDELEMLSDDSLENRLDIRTSAAAEYFVQIFSGTREEMEDYFRESGMVIALDIEHPINNMICFAP